MRVFNGIIFMVIVSYCKAQKACEVPNSLEMEEGVCVELKNCEAAPDPHELLKSKSSSSETELGRCGFREMCCPKDKLILDKYVDLKCGYSNLEDASMNTTKSDYAAYGEYPWMIALMIKKDSPVKTSEYEYIGGGTLIHPAVVMTVAHKVYKVESDKFKCRAGEWNWLIEEKYGHQESDVREIIINEQFILAYIHYDVALLVLSSPFDLASAPHIGVGCLEPKMPLLGTTCYSMGWGKDINNHNKNAVTLKKLELPLIEEEACEKKLKTTELGRSYKLHKSMMCAGGKAGVDTCKGDGGSPLVCPIPDSKRLRYSVVGMVAYGAGCGEAGTPGVYSRVSLIYDWVVNKMTERRFITNTFKYNIM